MGASNVPLRPIPPPPPADGTREPNITRLVPRVVTNPTTPTGPQSGTWSDAFFMAGVVLVLLFFSWLLGHAIMNPQKQPPRGFPVRVVDSPLMQSLRERIEAIEERLEMKGSNDEER